MDMSGNLGASAHGPCVARGAASLRYAARVPAARSVLTRRRFVDFGLLTTACCRPR
ncbi:hypothetical protein FRAHR75_280062 [Frankia sp. Hr75.2]|nr:hypothetical protein FRAHR75_280062 [Frankia sp. Hr75.2]SQE00921.1 hypothetical protein FMEAI12_7470006 [Parafrankia sp. Ea1.12]